MQITIDLDRVPIGEGVSAVAQDAGIDAAELASTGGEDFELLVAVDPATLSAGHLGSRRSAWRARVHLV